MEVQLYYQKMYCLYRGNNENHLVIKYNIIELDALYPMTENNSPFIILLS